MYYCCGISDKGVMPHNEDALLINGHITTDGMIKLEAGAPFIMAVADGVSGENSGEIASSMCLGLLNKITDCGKETLEGELMAIHENLAEFSRNSSENRNMQTTLCGIAIARDGTVVAFNAGDSRLYRLRDGELQQLSRDQSLVQLLYEEGSITMEERRTHVHRNIIFPVLGNLKDSPHIVVGELDGGFRAGDVIMLCTDGLSDYLSNEEIRDILEQPKSLPNRLETLVRSALEHESDDNITIAAAILIDN